MRAQILSASAGSGKTYRLAYKFVHDTIKYYRDKPYLYRAILAVTFTNKATEEMKSRILKEINDLIVRPAESSYMADLKRDLGLDEAEIVKRARSIQTKILHDYSRFTILTIDKFFQRILRAFIRELGIDLNYNIEIETSTVLTRSADSLIDDITGDDTLRQWIMEFAQEKIDDNSQWDIRRDLLALGRELFNEQSRQTVMNSTSKEELQKAIREAEKRSARARADMKAAAEKALEIMDRAGVCPTDFAGKSRSFAKYFSAIAAGDVKEPTATARQRAASPDGWAAKGSAAQAAAPELQPLLAEICDTFDRNRRLWSTLPLVKSTYRSYALLQDIYKRVRDLCEEEGIMLLSETKYILSRFVAGNDAPFIYEKTGNRFERFMIDEFQDTSIREWENFVPLLQNAMSQSEDTSVLIVGDVKQSIYRWRGGDWRILQHGVRKALGDADTELRILSDNYRSLPRIVEFNNTAMARVVERDNADLDAALLKAAERGSLSRSGYDDLRGTLRSAYEGHAQTPRRKSRNEGYVRIETFEQTPPLVECIESIIARGYSYNDIMILYRKASDGLRTARILLEYKRRNNTFNIMTQDALIVGNAPVSSFVTSVMRLSQDPNDSISRAVMNDYLGRDYDAPLAEDDRATLARICRLTPEEAFEKIVLEYRLDLRHDEIAYLQALHEQIAAFCAAKVADIQLFLAAWDEKGSAKALSVEKSDSTIELTTIHKSKGLERKVVVIPYCNWSLDPAVNDNIVWAAPDEKGDPLASVGRFPVEYKSAMSDSIFSDEYYREKVYSHVDNVNMLYVALTRAKEALYVFIPRTERHNTGRLLWEAVRQDADPSTPERVEYGAPEPPEPENKKSDGVRSALLEEYPTSDARMTLRLPSQRYFEDGAASLAPRNTGILMHGILNEATDAADAERRIGEARAAGRLSDGQAEELAATIRRELNRPEVAEWFAPDFWDEIRNENDIISGAVVGTRRPDRVMIKGDRVTVVDYKFGADKHKAHLRQTGEYMRLIAEMGYGQVEGYVWYLSLGEIVKVEIPT